MPMTLVDVYAGRVSELESDRSEAQDSLNTHIQNLGPAEDEQQQALRALSQIANDIAETRRQLAAAPLPSDAEALAETLRDQIIVQRKRRAAKLNAEQTLDEVRRAKAMASAALATAEAKLETARADLASAEERQDRHAAWSAALTVEPLLGLPAAAEAVQAGVDFGEAAARVTGAGADLPEMLRTRAQQRRIRELERQAERRELVIHAAAQHDDQQKSDAGLVGQTHELRTAFLAAEEAFGDYVLRSQQRFEKALFDLTTIKESLPLTPEQQARLTDDSLQDARQSAVEAEEERDAALKLVETKRIELVKARLEVKKNNVDLDPAGVDAEPAVAEILAASGQLESDLATKEAALDATTQLNLSHRRQLDLWEAAAPEHVWENLAAFEAAKANLAKLVLGPGMLGMDLTSAESALATALSAHNKSERTREYLIATIEKHQAALDFAVTAEEARIASQVRGDQ